VNKVNRKQIENLRTALMKSWSIASSSKWTAHNPAKGQCGVTALVVKELLGGDIRKTRIGDAWHFYNVIGGVRYDFTASQFDGEIEYGDLPSNNEEAFLDTNDEQLSYLRQKVKETLV
jgi:hypothetical protein